MTISCSSYDQLEIAAMRGQKVRLTFKPSAGDNSIYEGLISDLFCQNGEEFLKTPDNQIWPLEGLLSIEILTS